MLENDTIAQVTETVSNDSTVQAMAETVQMLRDTPVSVWLPQLVKDYLVPLGIKIVVSILVLIIGRWIIKMIKNRLEATCQGATALMAVLYSGAFTFRDAILNRSNRADKET